MTSRRFIDLTIDGAAQGVGWCAGMALLYWIGVLDYLLAFVRAVVCP